MKNKIILILLLFILLIGIVTAKTVTAKSALINCYDKDDEFTKGCVNSVNAKGKITTSCDVCSSRSVVKEFYCKNNVVNFQQIKCANGCKNGACVNSVLLTGMAVYEQLPYCKPGDANQDGKVDRTDLLIWRANYDPLGLNASTNNWSMGNWNYDDYIDGDDLALWQQNYNSVGTGNCIIKPEPYTNYYLFTGDILADDSISLNIDKIDSVIDATNFSQTGNLTGDYSLEFWNNNIKLKDYKFARPEMFEYPGGYAGFMFEYANVPPNANKIKILHGVTLIKQSDLIETVYSGYQVYDLWS